jgi:hypothetical protein
MSVNKKVVLLQHEFAKQRPCALCSQAPQVIHHLLLGCVYSREVWHHLLRPLGLLHLLPMTSVELVEWWLSARKRLPRQRRKRFDSLVILIWWSLWKERNYRVFNNVSHQAGALVSCIRSLVQSWVAAGFFGSPA